MGLFGNSKEEEISEFKRYCPLMSDAMGFESCVKDSCRLWSGKDCLIAEYLRK